MKRDGDAGSRTSDTRAARRSLLRSRTSPSTIPVRSGLFGARGGQVHAVDDVSFDIADGETLGLVGESGCGKSTTGKSILRLIEPTSGTITWRGQRIEHLERARDARRIRRELQAVFQDPYASLNPRMRAADIVAEPIRNFESADEREIDERVAALFEQASGCARDQMVKYPYEFSGGQRQRLGIARALAPRPKLIVCDEPVSALDVSVQAQVDQPADGPAGRAGAFLPVHRARPRGRRAHQPSRRRDVPRQDRRACSTSESLFGDPQHPYTEALLSAVPVPDPRAQAEAHHPARRRAEPDRSAVGCRFHTRCPYACERCRVEEPLLKEVRPGISRRATCVTATTRRRRCL